MTALTTFRVPPVARVALRKSAFPALVRVLVGRVRQKYNNPPDLQTPPIEAASPVLGSVRRVVYALRKTPGDSLAGAQTGHYCREKFMLDRSRRRPPGLLVCRTAAFHTTTALTLTAPRGRTEVLRWPPSS